MSASEQTLDVARDDSEKPLTKWKKEPTVLELKQDLTEAQTNHSNQTAIVQVYLDNLNVEGAAKIKTPEGRSSIVPKLIRKQAEWRYAALSEPFLSTPDMFTVSPVTWEDKDGAIQNQILLNNQFNTKIKKTQFIDEYVRTGVDEGTIICRTGWAFEEEEYETDIPEITFSINPELAGLHEELAQMKAANPAQYYAEVPEELQEAHELTLEHGAPIEPEIVGMTRGKKTRTIKNHPTVEVCDYRNVIIDPTCQGDLDKAGFIIYSFESSLSELEKDGKYKNLKQINVDNNQPLAQPDHATDETSGFNFRDAARKKIVVYEYWGFRDIDGSGAVKPIVAAWVGNTLIRMEENPFPDKKLPFVKIQYLPKRKSIYGEPDGALLEDNQKVLGAVTRGMIDLMGRSANGQMGTRKDALDAVNKRKFKSGQDYEFNQNVDPQQGMYMHKFAEIPNSAYSMLQQQNMEAESLTGVKSFSQGVSGQALGQVAVGVRGALDASSKRELGILRRLSEGLTEIGRKIISMNAVFLDEEEVVRVTNDVFVPIKRDDLAGEYDLKLAISTAEEDDNKAKELSFMLQTMGNNMDPKMSNMILEDIARLRKMPELAHKIENYEPQPDPHQQEMQQLEKQKLMAEIAEIESRTQENYAEAQLDMAKAGSEGAKSQNLQSDTDRKNLDYVEPESGVTQERELQKQGEQARSQGKVKLLDYKLKQKQENDKELRKYLTTDSA